MSRRGWSARQLQCSSAVGTASSSKGSREGAESLLGQPPHACMVEQTHGDGSGLHCRTSSSAAARVGSGMGSHHPPSPHGVLLPQGLGAPWGCVGGRDPWLSL